MFLLGQFVVGLRRKAHKSKLKNDRPIAGCWANLQQLVHLLAAAPWNLDPRVGGACRLPAGRPDLVDRIKVACQDEPEQMATPALFALACTQEAEPARRGKKPPHVAGRRRAGASRSRVDPTTAGARRRRPLLFHSRPTSGRHARHHSARGLPINTPTGNGDEGRVPVYPTRPPPSG